MQGRHPPPLHGPHTSTTYLNHTQQPKLNQPGSPILSPTIHTLNPYAKEHPVETVPNHPRPTEGRTESILSSDDFTVIADRSKATGYDEWESQHKNKREHQSEAQLEAELIETLKTQGYDYLPRLTDEAALIRNLREQLERLNTRPEEGAYGPHSGFHFTDEEFNRLLTEHIARSNDGILEKAKLIQEERFIDFRLEDGTLRNIMLIDAAYPARNHMQVINQYRVPAPNGKVLNRYDVTILVNGLPLVHIELKKRNVSIREAFNQIERYQNEGFQQDQHRLFEYAQIFVISNGFETKYYSNTVRHKHVEDQQKAGRKTASGGSAGKSFDFTSYWSDEQNNRINDLILFARTFLTRHTLANVLTRYCIFTVGQDLLVMRPYQIAATEKIIKRVEIANNNPKILGTKEAGGYIWHTTGSGKTLTSFKTARRLAETGLVDKVIFVVDRKDLDYQTMLEYNNFQADSVSSTGSTRELSERLADRGTNIVVTTIHKLSNLITADSEHPVYGQRVAIIFDECHRSQFGRMNTAIKKSFKKYSMFGFTGTPIFEKNSAGGPGTTTVEVFGDCLHTYTVVDAINDKNVLKFHLEYTNTSPHFAELEEASYAEEIAAEHAETPDAKELEKFAKSKEVLESPERIEAVATYILDNYDRKTNQSAATSYDIKKTRTINGVTEHYVQRVRGFNSILATSSIDAACTYYDALNTLQEERIADGTLRPEQKLKVAIIYSQGNGGQLFDTFGEEENFTFATEGTGSRMDGYLEDYNTMFGTNFSTDGDSFDNYYKDVSRKMKMRELDLLIVVNMFLTGFDSKTVNTLWVDKNLKMHGLVQAYSRTNRILNSLKPSGNIVCFRDLEQATKDAFTLFGDTENSSGQSALDIAFTRPYKEAYAAYDKAVSELREEFPIDEGGSITVDTTEDKARYIEVMNRVLKLQQELRVHDEFIRDGGNELISDYDMQGYTGVYNDIYEEARELRREQEEAKDGADSEGDGEEKPTAVDLFDRVSFLTELVRQQEVGVLYILELVKAARAARHGKAAGESGTAETAQDSVEYFRDRVRLAIRNDADLRESGDIIEDYFDTYLNESDDHDVQEHFHRYVTDRRTREEDTIVKDEELDSTETQRVVNRALKENRRTIPGKISRLIKGKISLFGGKFGGAKTEDAATKTKRVKQKLEKHIVRFMPFLGGE